MSTTASTFMQQIDECKTTAKKIEAVMASSSKPEWFLIAPDGRVWQGDQRTVARVLLQNIDVAELFTEPT